MKKKVRSLSLVFVFALFAMLIPILSERGTTAFAADGFVVNSSGVLTEYTGSGGVVSVTGNVTELGNNVFSGRSDITEIRMNSGLKKIGDYAFYGCTSLKKILIPWSVSSVGSGAFDNCTNLSMIDVEVMNENYCAENGVLFSKNKVQLIRFPQGKSADHYIIPDGVEIIGQSAFNGCSGIKTITISGKVISIRKWAFDNCSALTAINTSGNEKYRSAGGVLYTYDKKTLVRYPEGKTGDSYTVLSSVKTIGDSAFSKCKKLKKVILPEGLTTLEPYSFDQCSGLESMTIPASVTSIARYSFRNAYHMTRLFLLAKAPAIEDKNAFANNSIEDVFYSGGATQWANAKLDDVFGGKHIVYDYSPLTITNQPVSQTIAFGDSVTVSIGATGAGLHYQWYYKKAGQTAFSLWNGRTHASETCVPNATWDGIELYCKITDSAGNTVNSHAVKITLYAPIVNINGPDDQIIRLKESVTVSVEADCYNPKYQWYYKKAGQNDFSKWNGRTHASETCTPNITWDGIQLFCRITNGLGESQDSDTCTIHVMSITQEPRSRTIVKGSSVTLSVKATGGSGLRYQWYYKKKNQTSFSLWNGRTNASETVKPNDSWDSIQLYCTVSGGSGKNIDSDIATICFGTPMKITRQPANQSVGAAGEQVKLSLQAEGTGLKYQWYFKKVGQTGFTQWNGRTRPTETVVTNTTWNAIQLYCKITDISGDSVKSNTVTVSFK